MTEQTENCELCDEVVTTGTAAVCEACGAILCRACVLVEGVDNVVGGNSIRLCPDCFTDVEHCGHCNAPCINESQECLVCGKTICEDCQACQGEDSSCKYH